jgi:hypothetical protein
VSVDINLGGVVVRELLEGLDPSTRYGLLVALVFVLPLGTVVLTGLLGHTVSYVRDEPAPGRVLSFVMVGVLTLAFGIGGIVTWAYMSRYGWFPGLWPWFWGAVWLSCTISSFEVPKRRYGKDREDTAVAA